MKDGNNKNKMKIPTRNDKLAINKLARVVLKTC
jgi:hypothetical protein